MEQKGEINIQPEQKEETRVQKNEERYLNLCNNLKHSNIQIIVVPEGEQQQGIKNLFEQIMKENFPNLVKEIDCQEVQRVPQKLDPKKNTPRHIIIMLPKIKDKKRILKAAREKEELPTKECPLGYQLISQKKPCRQEEATKKYGPNEITEQNLRTKQ